MVGSARGLGGGSLPCETAECSAAAALERYRIAGHAMGLTRLAPVTGLDRLGIPVAAAFRPNAPSVSVNHGKGLTLTAAKASALGEALELWHAESPDLPVIEASPADLRRRSRVAPIYELPQRAGSTIDEDRPLHWVTGRGLWDGAPVMVPLASVCMDLAKPAYPGSDQFAASSSGLGTGLSRDAALLHALCEVVERDAHAVWLLRGNSLASVTPVSPAAAPGPLSRAVMERIDDAGLAVGLADITSDIRIPCILTVLMDKGGRNPSETPFALGTACHPHPETALIKALTEAAQMRLLQITALRDDLTAADYRESNSRIWHLASSALQEDTDTFMLPEGETTPDTRSALQVAQKTLAQAWSAQPVLVDLSRDEIGVPVVKLLVPGLEDGVDLATHRLGQRGLQARLESA